MNEKNEGGVSKREKMVKTWIKRVVSYRWNLELMYFKCGNLSIFILYIIYHKAMLDSLHSL